jgi:hypothetical protein
MKEVYIIGKGNGWDDAPEEGDLWGIADLVIRRPITMMWEMHHLDEARMTHVSAAKYASAMGIPVMTLKAYDWLPTAIEYPIDEVKAEFLTPYTTQDDYFASTAAYMIAYALYQGYEVLNLYGVCLARFFYESHKTRPGVEFWLGLAIGRGVKINICSPYSEVMTTWDGRMYGYDRLNDVDSDL